MACFRAICQSTMGSLPSRRRTNLHLPGLSARGQRSGLLQEELLTVPDPPDESKAMAVALDSFPAGEHGELVLRLGEPLTIISDNGDWWRVMSEATNQEFSIPSSHVAKISHGWLYEGLNREKAEDLLLLPSNHGGSFLIRDSQTRRGAYSLSVRLSRPTSRDVVRHYRIHRLENGWFYISPRFTFPSLQALVDHYTEMADDLCSLLKEPCAFYRVDPLPSKNIPPPVSVQKPALNWEEVDSSLLFSEVSASGDTSPISVGLREAIGTYISMTEDPSLDISGQRRHKKGNKDKAL
ncbi:src-like-adapter 2 [Antechinus flavipes]|uniref:src-like-adapter 2 n=1 Tax=Antechinus flavipes TaxID=38775 RepID=UPI002235DACB|nr:src-like-adapter 2 [Antechinus flavipes]